MDRALTLSSPEEPRVRLRAAAQGDLAELRAWKNVNKAGFFFKGDITEQMQQEWFDSYRKRPEDFMFIVEHEGAKAGCMAVRRMPDGSVDAYNMIVAPGFAGKGLMRAAMRVMCSWAAASLGKDIGCLVLKGNPALRYYQACGYRVVGDGGDHDVLKLDWTLFKPCPVREG
jgi:RimJ/RimL family protein N-acetyltransferase